MKIGLCLFIVALCASLCASAQATSPETVAKLFVQLVSTAQYNEAVRHFDATVSTAMDAARLKQTWDTLQTQVGAFKRQTGATSSTVAGYRVVLVACEFDRAVIDVKCAIDSSNRIAGLFFVPHLQATVPGYVKHDAFTETEVTVGAGKWKLAGSLTLPKGKGPFSAVVLVHGSGPNDRDETLNAGLKPFRDLAWGLASRNIAVLRYEKRTHQYSSRFARFSPDFTVKQETVDDACAAVELLRATPRVARNRVYVLGHSLGGMMAPRIALSNPHTAGIILMAGLTRNLEDTILEQMQYLTSLDTANAAQAHKQMEAVRAAVAQVKALKPSDAAHPDHVIYGAPPSYWLDMRGYSPCDTIKRVSKPILVLQGGRDYQVTMVDYANWQHALAAHPNASFRAYADLNHCFAIGKGKATPQEYAQLSNVDSRVIGDIAEWITALATPNAKHNR